MANPSLALNGVTPDTPGGKPGKQLSFPILQCGSDPFSSVLIVDGARCNAIRGPYIEVIMKIHLGSRSAGYLCRCSREKA